MLEIARKMEALNEREKRLTVSLELMISIVEDLDWRAGVCCCGDSMEEHCNPFDCGHSAVDMGEYYVGRAVEHAKTVLKETVSLKEES